MVFLDEALIPLFLLVIQRYGHGLDTADFLYQRNAVRCHSISPSHRYDWQHHVGGVLPIVIDGLVSDPHLPGGTKRGPPVLGFTSNRGKLLEEISTRIRCPRLNRFPVA